ncbi:MAG: thiol reductant ABC exporter subunit CydC [Bulleidia sp.]
MKKRSGLRIMLELSHLVKPLAGKMACAVAMGVVGNLCAALIPVLACYAILHTHRISRIAVTLIIMAVARGFLRYGEQRNNHDIAFRLLALIREKVFAALRRLSPAKLEGRDAGDLISLITSDIELLEVFYAHTISPIMIAVIFSMIMVCLISFYSWIAGMIAVIAYVLVGVVVPIVTSKASKENGMQFRTASASLSGFVLESLRGLPEIIGFGQGTQRLSDMQERTGELSSIEKRMKDITGKNKALTNAVVLFADLIMVMVCGGLYAHGALNTEGTLICVTAMLSSFGPVIALADLGSTLQNTLAAGNRVLNLLHEQPITEEIENGKQPEYNGITCSHVGFAYGDETILKDVNVDVKPGMITGIIGKSGSGKSTLLKLMMRLWECDEGKITIHDTDINEITTSHLRNMESFMRQETQMFHDTIRNNILLAKPDADENELIEACQKASIHDFIMSLPQGYDTQVGELGDTLSGGEKQRIGLARAFLHDAPVMLLDEPTSNLDGLNEAVILKSLKEEKQDRTVILVSHRPSTMKIADHVISVENGRFS